jgi:hypothetical protein
VFPDAGEHKVRHLVLTQPFPHYNPMRSRPLIALGLCSAIAAVPAGTAEAFTVSSQAEIRPPKRFPVAMPGGFKQGARIPRGNVLLRRSVEIFVREGRRNITFRCPGGRRIRTIATNDPSPVGLGVENDQRNYTRRSSIRLFVYAARTLVGPGEAARGRVYVLCRPR